MTNVMPVVSDELPGHVMWPYLVWAPGVIGQECMWCRAYCTEDCCMQYTSSPQSHLQDPSEQWHSPGLDHSACLYNQTTIKRKSQNGKQQVQ